MMSCQSLRFPLVAVDEDDPVSWGSEGEMLCKLAVRTRLL